MCGGPKRSADRWRVFRFSMGFPRLNGRQGGDIVQLVLDNGKLKPPDIYRLLQESTPNLCERFVSFPTSLCH